MEAVFNIGDNVRGIGKGINANGVTGTIIAPEKAFCGPTVDCGTPFNGKYIIPSASLELIQNRVDFNDTEACKVVQFVFEPDAKSVAHQSVFVVIQTDDNINDICNRFGEALSEYKGVYHNGAYMYKDIITELMCKADLTWEYLPKAYTLKDTDIHTIWI
jgi:hypothetical protein